MGNSEIKGINAYWVRVRIRVRVSYALLYTKGQGTWKTVSIFLSDPYVYFWNLILCIATFSFNIVLHLAWPSVSTGLDWGKSLKRYVVSCQRHFLLATLTILTLFSHFSQQLRNVIYDRQMLAPFSSSWLFHSFLSFFVYLLSFLFWKRRSL